MTANNPRHTLPYVPTSRIHSPAESDPSNAPISQHHPLVHIPRPPITQPKQCKSHSPYTYSETLLFSSNQTPKLALQTLLQPQEGSSSIDFSDNLLSKTPTKIQPSLTASDPYFEHSHLQKTAIQVTRDRCVNFNIRHFKSNLGMFLALNALFHFMRRSMFVRY